MLHHSINNCILVKTLVSKGELKMFKKIKQWFASWADNYGSELEQYIIRKQPTNVAEIELLVRDYDQVIAKRGFI